MSDGGREGEEPSRTPVISAPIRLETERLLLRRQREEDAAVFRRLWTERDERVPAHRRIDERGRPTVEDIADRIRREEADGGSTLLTVERAGGGETAGEVVGYCGLVFAGNGAPDEPEIAFELLREVHGSGYATEAGAVVMAWAREAGCRRVWATVWDWNVASLRVLDKLGFRDTGTVNPETPSGRTLLLMREL